MFVDVLKSENPFDKSETVLGCPKCKAVDTIVMLCDMPGCNAVSTCGKHKPEQE
jgi:hypothetical protein